jgi:glutamyl-tRNA reductase
MSQYNRADRNGYGKVRRQQCHLGFGRQIEKDYSMSKVAFLGMGVMGYPMAGHIAAAGHKVTVYNRTAAKSEAWAAQHGGAAALTPAAAIWPAIG